MEKGTAKRVAIIGAGPAGIVALKTLKEYQHHVTCFEKEASFGGLWNISTNKDIAYEPLENKQNGINSGYYSLIMNTCTSMSEFSDFPIDRKLDFLQHNEYLEYLGQYIANFDLMRYMKFNSTVNKVEKNGKEWLVKYTSMGNEAEEEHVETFDYILMATGAFNFPLFPVVQGLDSFPGLVVHSGQVRNENLLFRDKKIVVVGAANSGFELSCAALKYGASKVSLSVTESTTRRYQFIGNHKLPDPRQNGQLVPYDAYGITRYARDRAEVIQEFLTLWTKPVQTSIPSNHVFHFPKDGTVCTKVDLIDEMRQKGIFEKVGGVSKIVGSDVELDDGCLIKDVDIIVCATGFHSQFPMLSDVWSVDAQKKCELFWHMTSPDRNMDGVIFLDCMNTISGSLMPMMEMQARYTCEKILTRNYTDNGDLFTDAEREQMKKDIEEEKASNLTYNRAFNFLVDVVGYNIKLAKEIGCDPPDGKSFLQPGNSKEDTEFGVALYYGPVIPAQYRVSGSRCWDGAKEHIIDVAKAALGQHFDVLVKKHSTEIS